MTGEKGSERKKGQGRQGRKKEREREKKRKANFKITSSGKRVYFGQQGYNDYIIYNKMKEKKKQIR